MWEFRSDAPDPVRGGLRCFLHRGGNAATFEEVLDAWHNDRDFRSAFSTHLARVDMEAYRWETPPATKTTLCRPFEFVLLNSRGLARTGDPQDFANHFAGAPKDGVVQFHNLGRDAILVVPCPAASDDAYGHLAAFVRHAPPEQQQALWRAVATAMFHRVSETPVWLSTAGAGVPWLHIRLDDKPKYYGYDPYKVPPESNHTT